MINNYKSLIKTEIEKENVKKFTFILPKNQQ